MRTKGSKSDGFYRAFEDKHRGSRQLIRSRLSVYLPFIESLKEIDKNPSAVDLGCGRGEWLELLREAGVEAQGVDLDDNMLAACREIGLRVKTGDALAFLRELPDSSQTIVSGFHIAEHLAFADLRTLVQEAFRILKPAGLLILETPNPENLRVGATNFYTDPTHKNPLPPHLLSFLPEYYGYARIKVLRLQEPPELAKSSNVSLGDVLSGVSPDYAVVAQKPSDGISMAATGGAFEAEHGITLDELAERFDQQLVRQADEMTQMAQGLAKATAFKDEFAKAASAWAQISAGFNAEVASKNAGIAQREKKISELEKEVAAKNDALSARAAEIAMLNQREAALRQQLAAVENSRSWRITAPLRFVGRTVRWLARG